MATVPYILQFRLTCGGKDLYSGEIGRFFGVLSDFECSSQFSSCYSSVFVPPLGSFMCGIHLFRLRITLDDNLRLLSVHVIHFRLRSNL